MNTYPQILGVILFILILLAPFLSDLQPKEPVKVESYTFQAEVVKKGNKHNTLITLDFLEGPLAGRHTIKEFKKEKWNNAVPGEIVTVYCVKEKRLYYCELE